MHRVRGMSSSTTPRSVENLLFTLPTGFVSKKRMGARISR